MEYLLDSDITIQDEVLQREVTQVSSSKMKNIVATIQGQQNLIIRNEEARHLVIQGVAGSGKTSISLHRITFLINKFKDTIFSDDILIISSNLEVIEKVMSGSTLMTLLKSYLSTYEITEFTKRKSDKVDVEPLERHGEEPKINQFKSKKEKITYILESEYNSLGIICKTQARKLFELGKNKITF